MGEKRLEPETCKTRDQELKLRMLVGKMKVTKMDPNIETTTILS